MRRGWQLRAHGGGDRASGASCTLTSEATGSRTLVTPATVVVEKSKDNINVVCKKACVQAGVGVVVSNAEAMAAGNIIAPKPGCKA